MRTPALSFEEREKITFAKYLDEKFGDVKPEDILDIHLQTKSNGHWRDIKVTAKIKGIVATLDIPNEGLDYKMVVERLCPVSEEPPFFDGDKVRRKKIDSLGVKEGIVESAWVHKSGQYTGQRAWMISLKGVDGEHYAHEFILEQNIS